MKALVIGASGSTGKTLVEQLLVNPKYHEVVVFVRRKTFQHHIKLKEILIDFEKLDQYKDEMYGDVAFSCLGTTMKDAGSQEKQWKIDYEYQYKFAQNCKSNNVNTFVLMSAMGADSSSKIFYNRLKGTLENDIKKINFNQLIILQPGILIRPNSERNGEKLMVKVIKSFNQIGLFKKYEPQPVENIAFAMQKAIQSTADGLHVFTPSGIHKLLK